MPTGASPWSESFLLSFLAQLSGSCISGCNQIWPVIMDSLHTGLYVASHCQPIFSTWSCYKEALLTSHLFSSHLWTLKLFYETSSSRPTMKIIVQVYETKSLVATAQGSLVTIDFSKFSPLPSYCLSEVRNLGTPKDLPLPGCQIRHYITESNYSALGQTSLWNSGLLRDLT